MLVKWKGFLSVIKGVAVSDAVLRGLLLVKWKGFLSVIKGVAAIRCCSKRFVVS